MKSISQIVLAYHILRYGGDTDSVSTASSFWSTPIANDNSIEECRQSYSWRRCLSIIYKPECKYRWARSLGESHAYMTSKVKVKCATLELRQGYASEHQYTDHLRWSMPQCVRKKLTSIQHYTFVSSFNDSALFPDQAPHIAALLLDFTTTSIYCKDTP